MAVEISLWKWRHIPPIDSGLVDGPRGLGRARTPVAAGHRVARGVRVVGSQGDAAPEDAAVFAVLVGRRYQEAVRWQHADNNGHEELEVAVQVGEVEVDLVELHRPHRLKHDGDYCEAANGRHG